MARFQHRNVSVFGYDTVQNLRRGNHGTCLQLTAANDR